MMPPCLPRAFSPAAYRFAAVSLCHRPTPRSISARRSATLPSRLIRPSPVPMSGRWPRLTFEQTLRYAAPGSLPG
jgi:hypothetical protein